MENYNQERSEQPMSVTDWLVTLLITAIPLIGFIMLIVWACDANCPKNKSNWAKATLLMMVIGIVLVILLWIFLFAAFFAAAGAASGGY